MTQYTRDDNVTGESPIDNRGLDGPCKTCPKEKLERCENGKIKTRVGQMIPYKYEIGCDSFHRWARAELTKANKSS